MGNVTKGTSNQKDNGNPSYVLLLDFSKFEDFYVQEFAFDVLATKGKKKSKYVSDCLKYYFAHGGTTTTKMGGGDKKDTLCNSAFSQNMDATFSFLRYLKRISEKYDLNSLPKIMDFFNMDMNSPKFQEIKENTLPHQFRSRKMSLGFYKNDKEAANCFNALIGITMNERIALISNAIQMYVQDMQDDIIAEYIENQIIVEMITSCQSGSKEENDAKMTEFSDLLSTAKTLNIINSIKPIVSVGSGESVSNEVSMLVNSSSMMQL